MDLPSSYLQHSACLLPWLILGTLWQVGLGKAINFQVCTEPKSCILFLNFSFLKAQN